MKIISLQLLFAWFGTLYGERHLAFTRIQSTGRRPPPLPFIRLQSSKTDNEDSCLPSNRLPDSLIRALDLTPLLERVADHAGTKRGREAFLTLVKDNNKKVPTAFSKTNSLSKRDRLIQSAKSTKSHVTTSRSDYLGSKRLSPIASSAVEARKEYELVEEAMLALSDETYNLTYPPLYAVGSSPVDVENVEITDDDEWLNIQADSWTLENLLQAEQIIRKLIKVKEWALLDETQTWMPGLSKIGCQIDESNDLPILYSEIEGVVGIVRVRTLDDPTGKSVRQILFLALCKNTWTLSFLNKAHIPALDLYVST